MPVTSEDMKARLRSEEELKSTCSLGWRHRILPIRNRKEGHLLRLSY